MIISGKFFCLPHSTDHSLEKYRYRHKKDEMRDGANRKMETHSVTNEWGVNMTDRHRERLLAMEATVGGQGKGARGTRGDTPER